MEPRRLGDKETGRLVGMFSSAPPLIILLRPACYLSVCRHVAVPFANFRRRWALGPLATLALWPLVHPCWALGPHVLPWRDGVMEAERGERRRHGGRERGVPTGGRSVWQNCARAGYAAEETRLPKIKLSENLRTTGTVIFTPGSARTSTFAAGNARRMSITCSPAMLSPNHRTWPIGSEKHRRVIAWQTRQANPMRKHRPMDDITRDEHEQELDQTSRLVH